jgi:hypothetical protein
MVRAVAAEHGIVDTEQGRFGKFEERKKKGSSLGFRAPKVAFRRFGLGVTVVHFSESQ